jgi:hypothetical protein
MPEDNPAGVVIRTTRNEDSETLINNRQNGRRRGRGGAQVRGPGGGNGPDRGNRIDNRARGNAAQLHEKYRNLARDAQTQGDRVMTEYYLQFADHYFRVLNENRARFEDQNPNQQRRQRFENDDYEESVDEGEGMDEAADSEPQHHQQRHQEPRRDNREDRDYRRQDREPRRREREPVAAAPAPAFEPEAEVAAEAPREEAVAQDEGERRPRRGRRPRRAEAEVNGEEAPQRIEIDRLPPAFAPSEPAAAPAEAGAEAEAEPAPRRRRTRRAATAEDGTVAA